MDWGDWLRRESSSRLFVLFDLSACGSAFLNYAWLFHGADLKVPQLGDQRMEKGRQKPGLQVSGQNQHGHVGEAQ